MTYLETFPIGSLRGGVGENCVMERGARAAIPGLDPPKPVKPPPPGAGAAKTGQWRFEAGILPTRYQAVDVGAHGPR